MKALIGFATVLVALAAVTTADAKGCLKGAAVGGVAGHYSGHHGLLGAAAGCAIGRHEANGVTACKGSRAFNLTAICEMVRSASSTIKDLQNHRALRALLQCLYMPSHEAV